MVETFLDCILLVDVTDFLFCPQKEADRYSVARENVPNGKKEKSDYGNLIIGDDFKQPGDRIRAMKKESRDNFKEHITNWIADPKVHFLGNFSAHSGSKARSLLCTPMRFPSLTPP